MLFGVSVCAVEVLETGCKLPISRCSQRFIFLVARSVLYGNDESRGIRQALRHRAKIAKEHRASTMRSSSLFGFLKGIQAYKRLDAKTTFAKNPCSHRRIGQCKQRPSHQRQDNYDKMPTMRRHPQRMSPRPRTSQTPSMEALPGRTGSSQFCGAVQVDANAVLFADRPPLRRSLEGHEATLVDV